MCVETISFFLLAIKCVWTLSDWVWFCRSEQQLNVEWKWNKEKIFIITRHADDQCPCAIICKCVSRIQTNSRRFFKFKYMNKQRCMRVWVTERVCAAFDSRRILTHTAFTQETSVWNEIAREETDRLQNNNQNEGCNVRRDAWHYMSHVVAHTKPVSDWMMFDVTCTVFNEWSFLFFVFFYSEIF